MNQTELMIAIAGGLFAAFLLGWLAGWLALRAGDSGADREVPPPPTGLADMEARIAAADEAATRAEDDLRVAQIEIEELRNYIERKLAQTPGPS